MTVQIAALTDRALIRVTGPDARSFLHGLLTQDVEGLAPGELRYGALLSPPGRLLFDLCLFGLDDGVLIDVAAEGREGLMQRLGLYRLRAAVEIAPDETPIHVAWDGAAPGFVADPRLPGVAARLYAPAQATASLADWDAWRLAQGLPDTADMGSDRTYPIEANMDLLNGIDFKKGCFIGQETTSRMKRRGAIRNRMATLTFDGPPPAPGAEVLNGDRRAGQVLSGSDGMAMALLRLDRLDGALTVDSRKVAVTLPDWMPNAGEPTKP